MATILDDGTAVPAHWTARHAAGLDIYRNNYRTSLVEALAETYEHTQRWVGEESFRRAAAHHLILNPPSSWTLDDAGEGFDATLVELFANDPEVAELAALEWAMQRAFVAADSACLSSADFAARTAGFKDEEWATLAFRFVPGTALQPVSHDVATLWNALRSDDFEVPDITLPQPHVLLVWRESLRPAFRLLDAVDGEALTAAMEGSSFGDICARLVERQGPQEGVGRAGFLLGQWLGDGLVAALVEA